MKKVERVEGWRCTFCGEIFPTEEKALECWERHIEYETEFMFSLGSEFPEEVLIKKIEGSKITKIATYSKVKEEKVDLEYRGEKGGRKENKGSS